MPRATLPATAGLILCLVAGCAAFPELDDRFAQDARGAAYPDLVPVETLAGAQPEDRIAPDMSDRLAARIAGLRARAARLRGSVIDSASRARLSQPVTIAGRS